MAIWQPIFTKENEVKLINSKIELIRSQITNSQNISLFGGKAGIAIFYNYLYLLDNSSSNRAIAKQLILDCIGSLQNIASDFSFANGIAGIIWSISFQRNIGLIKAESDDIFNKIDTFIEGHFEEKFEEKNFDYLFGGLASGLYFIERLPNKFALKALERIIILLDNISEKKGKNITWEDSFSLKYEQPLNQKKYNLGLAHGIPSIICFLSKIYKLNINRKLSKNLLEGSTNWLLSHKLSLGNKSIFPAIIFENSPEVFSRLGWCYGDLSVAICLWQAGKSLGSNYLLQQAINILNSTIKRRSQSDTLVMDYCLCHGASGIAHIYNNFYQATRNNLYRQAAIHWYQFILQMKIKTDDFEMFKTWSVGDKNEVIWSKNLGLLLGASGIGLSLISSISNIKPQWDRCLLLS